MNTTTDAQISAMRDTYVSNDKAGRTTIRKGISGMIDTARLIGDLDTADRYAAILEDLVTAAEGVESDYEMAARVATFRAALADMEANLSDRARTYLDTDTVGVDDKLMARIAGLNVTRTAVSSDGGRRAGSNESKGNVPTALARFFEDHPAGVWYTTTEISNYVSANMADLGYTEAYPLSTGAISAVGASVAKGTCREANLIADLEFGPGNKGGANGAVRLNA